MPLSVVSPDTLDVVLAEPRTVLVLTKTDCDACRTWSEELEAWLATEPPEAVGVRFAKLVLNQPGLGAFKKRSPWLREVDVLPYTVVYRGGEHQVGFAGGGATRLASRLRRLLPADG